MVNFTCLLYVGAPCSFTAMILYCTVVALQRLRYARLVHPLLQRRYSADTPDAQTRCAATGDQVSS